MKITLTLAAVALTGLARAQFAPLGAQWTYDQGDTVYTMTSIGDTLIDGHNCSIISGSSFSSCWQSQAYTYQSGDTVFWSDDPYLPQFFELYRWNAMAGESWDVWTNGPVTVTYTVLGTGTTDVNGQTLRTLNVTATDTQEQWAQSSGVLIEHIGDTLFLFPWLAAFCDAIVPWPLRCYSDDDLGDFARPGVAECTATTSISTTEEREVPHWYPSMFVAGVPTTLRCADVRPTRIDVFDPAGRQVASSASTNGEAHLTLPRPGCYVLRWEHGDGPHIQRLLAY